MVLNLSNKENYYFHSLEGAEYYAAPHIGRVRDTFVIQSEDLTLNIGYYINGAGIHLYRVRTGGDLLMVKNVGEQALAIWRGETRACLQPGDQMVMNVGK